MQLTPKFLQVKPKNLNFHKIEDQNKYSKVLNIFYFQILNICISDCYSKINSHNGLLNKIKKKIITQHKEPFVNNFFTKQNEKYEFLFNKIKNKHKNKINNLMKKQHIPKDKEQTNENWIITKTIRYTKPY